MKSRYHSQKSELKNSKQARKSYSNWIKNNEVCLEKDFLEKASLFAQV